MARKESIEVKKGDETSVWSGSETDGQLVIDVYQTPDEIIIESPIAGVAPEDLDVSIQNDMVIIRGKREKKTEIKEEDYLYQECYWGGFSRSIILPEEINTEKSEATIKNGILTVKLPKLKRNKNLKLKIQNEE